jgi:hypothetical protein
MNVYLIQHEPRTSGPVPLLTVHIIDVDEHQVVFPANQVGELIHQLFEIHCGKTQPITEEELKLERSKTE